MTSLSGQITQLLRRSGVNGMVRRCLDALSKEASSSLQTTGPLPIQHVRRTLSLRAKTNAEGLGLVEGFDDVLEALSKETDESVNILFFDGDNDSFTIVTDSATTRLLGILISKNKGRKFKEVLADRPEERL